MLVRKHKCLLDKVTAVTVEFHVVHSASFAAPVLYYNAFRYKLIRHDIS